MKPLFILLCLLTGWFSLAQEPNTFTIIDQSDQEPIEFVNIINLNSRQLYYSDAQGKATVFAQSTDSLLITQLGYKEIRDNVENLDKRVMLEPNISTLDEIILVDRSKNILLNKPARSKHNYNINTALTCVFRCEVPNKSLINKIVLPIKKRNQYNSKGTLRFQLFKRFEDGKLSEPFTKVFVFEELEKIKENIIMEFSSKEIDHEFFIAATRNINNSTRVSTGAFNPFLRFGKSQQSDDMKFKHVLSDRWFNISWAIGGSDTYKLIFEAYGRPIKN